MLLNITLTYVHTELTVHILCASVCGHVAVKLEVNETLENNGGVTSVHYQEQWQNHSRLNTRRLAEQYLHQRLQLSCVVPVLCKRYLTVYGQLILMTFIVALITG